MLNSAATPRVSLPDYDAPLVWVLLLMLSFGLVMVYSASIDIAAVNRSTGHNYAYYLIRHAIYLIIGLAGGFAAFQVPTRLWQRGAPYLFLGGIALLVGVLIPGIGREVNGSYRWISLHVVNVQPSELMKLFVV
ncbi:MAG TPA: cell division protein FtsW, partial [Betaproteobacteria bacterium]|nr:cell division protein FtsW [Betaproteobacteria bacterium]